MSVFPPSFRTELESLINRHSKENRSNTPDFILAGYLERCLEAFDLAVKARECWYGGPKGVTEVTANVVATKVTSK